MRTHVIEQGRHRERLTWRALLDRLPWVSLSGRPSWRRTVVFTDSCRYTLPPADQADANKLGGLSFGGGPHGNSARVGWAYNPATDRIDLTAYFYTNGERQIEWAASARIGEPVDVGVTQLYGCAEVRVNGRHAGQRRMERARFGLRLGLFFGGNNPAPHRMRVEME